MFGSWQRDLKPIALPWQQHIGYHFASYLMYITGAKFEWHHSNVFRNERSFKKETSILTYFSGPFKLLHRVKIVKRGKLGKNGE